MLGGWRFLQDGEWIDFLKNQHFSPLRMERMPSGRTFSKETVSNYSRRRNFELAHSSRLDFASI